jgi:pSer/pThr/pTyr-binding forkhead associated (FHA) protein
MRDGMTRKQQNPSHEDPREALLSKYRGSLVIVSGRVPGNEIELSGSRTIVGRGPGVDVTIPDEAMSRQHFAIEATSEGFRLHDLASTNGVLLNEKAVESATLEHGDRVKAGDHEFRFLLERIEREPRTYVISE